MKPVSWIGQLNNIAMNNGQYSKIFDRWMQQMTNQYICIWEVWEQCNNNAKVYTFKQSISKRKSVQTPFSLLFSFEPVHNLHITCNNIQVL